MAENIVTGRKYRILTDAAQQLWDRVSFWSKASDTEYNDGKNAETKNGAINGITSDVNGEANDVAASIKVVHDLNDSLGGFKPVIDPASGQITGYQTKVGADTVFPFSGGKVAMAVHVSDTNTTTFNIGFKPKKLIFVRKSNTNPDASVLSIIYDEEVSDTKYWRYGDSTTQYDIGNGGLTELTDTGFILGTAMVQYRYSYLAVG